MGIELNSGQLFCSIDIENWWHNSTRQVYEISGPAGSGKTTMILYAIDKLGIELENVAFLAYMGKAVTQMMRNKLPARTIHSFIYRYVKVPVRDENGNIVRKPNGKTKMKGEFQLVDQLPENIELIVIDEGSMVSEKIAMDILSFGKPVIVMSDHFLNAIFTTEERRFIQTYQENGYIDYESLLFLDTQRKMCFHEIAYQSIGNPSGRMLCFIAEEVVVPERACVFHKQPVAIGRDSLFADKTYDGLLFADGME